MATKNNKKRIGFTSDNTIYAVSVALLPTPKLPSFDEVMEECYDGCMDEDTIKDVYEAIKKLGNFASNGKRCTKSKTIRSLL